MDVLGQRQENIQLTCNVLASAMQKQTKGALDMEDTMPTFKEDAAFTSYKPTAEEAAKANALINFLMEDRLFLALYRSNDPKVRVAAMNKLNDAHHQAYGDAPTKDDDAGTGRK